MIYMTKNYFIFYYQLLTLLGPPSILLKTENLIPPGLQKDLLVITIWYGISISNHSFVYHYGGFYTSGQCTVFMMGEREAF